MANLICYLSARDPSRTKMVSRVASEFIEARLETWHGMVRLRLNKDGSWQVWEGPKASPEGHPVTSGNCDLSNP